MAHLAAYVTVCGGLSGKELRAAAQAESEAIGYSHPQGWGVLADGMWDALREGEGAKAVQPDVVGEALLLVVWGGSRANEGAVAVGRAGEQYADRVAAVLVRCAQDFCLVEAEHPEPLQWLDMLVEKGKRNPALLWRMAAQLPDQSVALRERATTLYEHLVSALRSSAVGGEDDQSTLALSLNNLGARLSDLGRREEALGASEEAVTIYRELAAGRPDMFQPDLALSLGTKGAILSADGNAPGSAECFREGMLHLKPLFLSAPDAFRSLMTALTRAYFQACQTATLEPDMALLTEVFPQLTQGQANAAGQ